MTTRSDAGSLGLQPDEPSIHDLDDEISLASDPKRSRNLSPSVRLPPAAIMPGPSRGVSPHKNADSSSSVAVSPDNDPSRTRSSESTRPRDRSETRRPELIQYSNTLNMGMLPRIRKRSAVRLPTSLRKGGAGRWELNADEKVWDPTNSVPLVDLMPLLTNTQKAFFSKLDGELDKIETFYVKQEKEMTTRYENGRTL